MTDSNQQQNSNANPTADELFGSSSGDQSKLNKVEKRVYGDDHEHSGKDGYKKVKFQNLKNVFVLDSTPDFEGEEYSIAIDKTAGSAYMLIGGSWINMTGGGWDLVTHSEASAVENITISNLDLETDKHYKILVMCKQTTSDGTLNARMNNDSSGNHNYIHNQAFIFAAGAPTNGTDAGIGSNQFKLGTTALSHQSIIDISHNSGKKMAIWQTNSIGDAALGLADYFSIVNGSGYYDSSSNLTSIKFYFSIGGSSCEWEVFVFKPKI